MELKEGHLASVPLPQKSLTDGHTQHVPNDLDFRGEPCALGPLLGALLLPRPGNMPMHEVYTWQGPE